jgi:hypothetical protein
MDYNTQREHLVLPEYGRHVQHMVEYLLTITDRKRRSEQAAIVVRVMLSQNPQLKRVEEQERKVWEHLYMISGYRLDIDSRYPMHKPDNVSQEKPELNYPARKQRLNHYGTLVPKMLQAVSNLDSTEEKRLFALQTAHQMKRCYLEWNKSTVENNEILADVERLSDRRLNLEGATLNDVSVTPTDAGHLQAKKNGTNRPQQQGNTTPSPSNKQYHHNKNKKRRAAQ